MGKDIVEMLSYSSFFWSLGTTSFRTKEFNYSIEKQLACLDDFGKYLRIAIRGGKRSIWLLVKWIYMKSRTVITTLCEIEA